MRPCPAVAVLFASLAFHNAAQAQSSVDQARATVSRLLNGAGAVVVFTSGRTIESTHSRVSAIRTINRCTTGYNTTYPAHPDLPKNYHGVVEDDHELKWDKLTPLRVSGDHFFFNSLRKATGRSFTYHFKFDSAAAATQFAQAATVLIAACRNEQQDEQRAEEVVHNPRGKTASLAIDRRNGSRYGWAVDYESLSASDARALAECNKGTSNCQVVLRFTGGCGAYAADQAKGSSVYGWGTAGSRNEAESRARSEAQKRGGTSIVTRVWGCNSVKTSGAAKTSGVVSTNSGTGSAGNGLSDEVVQRNAEAQRAHQATVDNYQSQLKANEQTIAKAIAERRAVQEEHERELAKARAAREKYERERQAYREEYKRITGRYPDE